MWRGLLGLLLACFGLGVGCGVCSSAAAQAPMLELTFTPTKLAQIAVWVEREDGTYMGTLALTYAVAKAGIGNRPGALQMNSGHRWPYGRREGVLPVWAHRRAAAAGAKPWKRVIFQNRTWEGLASRTSNDNSPDDYYCLSFNRNTSGKEALDATTCASVFSSDKGRYITDADVTRGYGEPYEDRPGVGRIRKLSIDSLYPPRRDLERCTMASAQVECFDHPDVADFRNHALSVMPELDAITRATLPGERPVTWDFSLPAEWPKDQRYKLFVEVNVEGDYNAQYDEKSYPTPRTPEAAWDSWSWQFGYAYRGQPSVVYALPFAFEASQSSVLEPIGFGALQGEDGNISPMTKSISNDPSGHKGSGADRLLTSGNARLNLRVVVPDSAYCALTKAPAAVSELKVEPHPHKQDQHTWALLSFKTPASQRPVNAYLVEVKADNSEWEPAFTPDQEQTLLPVALDLCDDPDRPGVNRCEGLPAGSPLQATIAGLKALTHYSVRVTPRERSCGESGPTTMADVTTKERVFATVTPCFVASAAFGSPLAGEISVLRGLRDRHLSNHHIGRALVRFYYAVGPELAEPVARYAWLGRAVRAILAPIVTLTRWWMD